MQRSKKVGFVASLALVAVVVASSLAGVSKVSATCGNVGVCWHNVASVNPGAGDNALNSVYAVSSTNIWAVGYYKDINQSNAKTLIENGVPGSGGTTYTWSQSASTNPGTNNYLNGVGFARNDLNATDVWAVGDYISGGETYTLIEKYHSGTWTTVSSPSPSSSINVLTAIAGDKADSYWAVGHYYSSTLGANATLAEFWNGSSWLQVASANHTGTGTYNNYLTSVSMVASGDAWAVGYYNDGTNNHPLLLEWNASTSIWDDHSSDLPNSSNGATLSGISMLDHDDTWTVGNSATGYGELAFQHDVLHGWRLNDPPGGSGPQTAVAYFASGSAWAVGYHGQGCCVAPSGAYWNGTQWTTYAPVNAGTYGAVLLAVNGVSANDTWAVGLEEDLYTNNTLIEHYN